MKSVSTELRAVHWQRAHRVHGEVDNDSAPAGTAAQHRPQQHSTGSRLQPADGAAPPALPGRFIILGPRFPPARPRPGWARWQARLLSVSSRNPVIAASVVRPVFRNDTGWHALWAGAMHHRAPEAAHQNIGTHEVPCVHGAVPLEGRAGGEQPQRRTFARLRAAQRGVLRHHALWVQPVQVLDRRAVETRLRDRRVHSHAASCTQHAARVSGSGCCIWRPRS